METSWLSFSIAGNELWRIAVLFITVLGLVLIGRILQFYLGRTGGRMVENHAHETLGVALKAMARAAPFLFLALGITQGLKFLVLPEDVVSLIESVGGVLFALAVGYLVFTLIDVIDHVMRKRIQEGGHMDQMLVPMVRKSLRVTVVLLTLVQIAQSLSDQPITSILAGLGVGGLAVALAAQDSIKNFFGSLVLMADKPFEIGDRVVIGEHDGIVQNVGMRSTRLRTLEGHMVTIPNGDLANQAIRDISKRLNIRRILNVTITYDTPPEKVERAVAILKELLDNHEGMDPELPPRVLFNDFNSASLNIFVIYWYHPPEWWDYQYFSEKLNMQILRRFNEEGIDFAFPTQTLHLAGDPKRPLDIGVRQEADPHTDAPA